MDHQFFMNECLRLAEAGRHQVGNGALVGSVLVREGNVIAEGSHKKFGNSHSERELLEKFEQKIDTKDVLFVNLEPCCHQGKTPPCTDIILERGIKNVVFGMFDPDPRVSGQGIKKLRDNGVNVFGPVMRAECEYFNRGFVSVRTKSRPFITLKQARTKDGHLAKPDGSPLKITSKEQDIWSHTNLRFPADGIVCGVGTIMSDNPQLNTRLVQKNALQKEVPEPYRIILDPEGRIPLNSKVLTDGNQSRTMVIVSERTKKEVQTQISATSAMAIQCPVTGEEFDLPSLFQRIITPNGDYHGLTSLLVEGGKRTWESFKRSGFVDEEVMLIGS